MSKIILLVLITLLVCSGCSTLRPTTPILKQSTEPIQQESQTVTVGGSVRVPLQIEHNDTLTLERAINLAGGSVPSPTNQPLLVSLSEKQGVLRQRIFIPLNFVLNSAAGQIQVPPGSHVDIVEKKMTTLVKSNNAGKAEQNVKSEIKNPVLNRARIAGLVRNAKSFDINDESLKSGSDVLSLSQVINSAVPIDASQVNVALILRPIPGFVKPDIYLIPYLQGLGVQRSNTKVGPADTSSKDSVDNQQDAARTATDVFRSIAGTSEESEAKSKVKPATAGNFSNWGNTVEVLPLDTIFMTTLNSIPLIKNGQLAPLRDKIRESISAQLETRQPQSEKRNGLFRNRR